VLCVVRQYIAQSSLNRFITIIIITYYYYLLILHLLFLLLITRIILLLFYIRSFLRHELLRKESCLSDEDYVTYITRRALPKYNSLRVCFLFLFLFWVVLFCFVLGCFVFFFVIFVIFGFISRFFFF
jgi:hypothetical protein